MTDLDQLAAINIQIGAAEAHGDKAYFRSLLAPAFAMRRANGTIENRRTFIRGVAESAERTTAVESISLHGTNRAIASCVVTMETDEGPRRFHNLRLFVRETGGSPWLLMAWANEIAD